MCGRTVSTLNRNQLRRACTYTYRHGRRMRPGWRNRGPGGGGGGGGGGRTRQAPVPADSDSQPTSQPQQSHELRKRYYQSYNIAPASTTPVLLSCKHFQPKTNEAHKESSDELEIMPMTWGLVPAWHKGKASEMAYKMNNCRSEGMLEKASFKGPFERGQRCVVLVDGFYEWKKNENGSKQPYFIYFAQDHTMNELSINKEEEEEALLDMEVVNEPEEVGKDDPNEWKGHRLLTMAGLFDKWHPPQGGEHLYTYSVITVESNDSMSWLHHRMPAILDGEEEIKAWLEFGSLQANKKAHSLISARSCLKFHPVTNAMGNIRYKEPDCIKPVELGKPVKPKSEESKFMASWMAKGSKGGEKKSPSAKVEGGGVLKAMEMKKEKKCAAGGPLSKWLVKKEKTEEEDSKKRVIVKQEQPSPKKSRVQ